MSQNSAHHAWNSKITSMFFQSIPENYELTREGEVMLVKLAQEGNLEARNELIESNLPFVIFVAKKYSWINTPFLELIQEGVIGLIKGIEKFDPKLGYRFSTYSFWWISQEISRSTKSLLKEIRLPAHVADVQRNLYKTIEIMKSIFGHRPSITEIAEFMELPCNKVDEILSLALVTKSMQEEAGASGDSDRSLEGILLCDSDKQNDVEDEVFLNKQLRRSLHTLSPLGEYILRMRYAGQSQH